MYCRMGNKSLRWGHLFFLLPSNSVRWGSNLGKTSNRQVCEVKACPGHGSSNCWNLRTIRWHVIQTTKLAFIFFHGSGYIANNSTVRQSSISFCTNCVPIFQINTYLALKGAGNLQGNRNKLELPICKMWARFLAKQSLKVTSIWCHWVNY